MGELQGTRISTNSFELVRVLQVNTQHAKQAQIEIGNTIDNIKHKFLILIQEPYRTSLVLDLVPVIF